MTNCKCDASMIRINCTAFNTNIYFSTSRLLTPVYLHAEYSTPAAYRQSHTPSLRVAQTHHGNSLELHAGTVQPHFRWTQSTARIATTNHGNICTILLLLRLALLPSLFRLRNIRYYIHCRIRTSIGAEVRGLGAAH